MNMKQNRLAGTLVVFFLLSGWAGAADRLITQEEAARHGLERAWFTQIRLDSGQSKISHLRLIEKTGRLPDTLFVQTDRAMVHAVDAETGQTLWARAVGSREHTTFGVGANAELVGVVNGTKLYLLDRTDGRVLWRRQIDGVPAEGPVFTNTYVFVPTTVGLVLAYPIEKEQLEEEPSPLPAKSTAAAAKDAETGESESAEAKAASPKKAEEPYRPFALKQKARNPLTCVSFGHITCQPIFTLEDRENLYLAWSTTRGLFVGYVDLQSQNEFAVAYHLRTHSEIVTQPTYLPPAVEDGISEGLIFTASKGGEIHAVSATRGAEIWTSIIGQPMVEPVIPIKDRAYVVTELGDCYCLNSLTGTQLWTTSDVSQFVAASGRYVYVADRAGQIRVLDAASGAAVDGVYASDLPIKFRNIRTDRIYLATSGGLVQCLHETAQVEPIRHRKKAAAPQAEAVGGEEFVPAEPAKTGEKPAAEEKPGEENPFGAAEGGGENPFEKPEGP